MEEHWKHWKKEHEIGIITSSVKKFEGKMTAFLYEEKITHLPTSNIGSLNANISKASSKIETISDKENTGVVITTSNL